MIHQVQHVGFFGILRDMEIKKTLERALPSLTGL